MPKICNSENCKMNVFGGGYCQRHQRERTDKKENKKENNRNCVTSKTVDKSYYIKSADAAFSMYIRLRDSVNGRNRCITCGKDYPILELDCGHWISRGNMSTRYEPSNCHPQCHSCNRHLDGMDKEHEEAIIRMYGTEEMDRLVKLAQEPVKYSTNDIKDIGRKYFLLNKKELI